MRALSSIVLFAALPLVAACAAGDSSTPTSPPLSAGAAGATAGSAGAHAAGAPQKGGAAGSIAAGGAGGDSAGAAGQHAGGSAGTSAGGQHAGGSAGQNAGSAGQNAGGSAGQNAGGSSGQNAGGSDVGGQSAGGAPDDGACAATGGALLDDVNPGPAPYVLGATVIAPTNAGAICAVALDGSARTNLGEGVSIRVSGGVVGLTSSDQTLAFWRPGDAAPYVVPNGIWDESFVFVGSPDGATVIYTAVTPNPEGGDLTSLYAYDFASGTTKTLVASFAGDIGDWTQAPTRSKSAFLYGTNGQITSYTFTGETHVLATNLPFSLSSLLTVPANSDLVIIAGSGGCTTGGVVANAATGETLAALSGVFDWCVGGAFTADGTTFFAQDATDVAAFDTTTGGKTAFDKAESASFGYAIGGGGRFLRYVATAGAGDAAVRFVTVAPLGAPQTALAESNATNCLDESGPIGTTGGGFVFAHLGCDGGGWNAVPVAGGAAIPLTTDDSVPPPIALTDDLVVYDAEDASTGLDGVVLHDLASGKKAVLLPDQVAPRLVTPDRKTIIYVDSQNQLRALAITAPQ